MPQEFSSYFLDGFIRTGPLIQSRAVFPSAVLLPSLASAISASLGPDDGDAYITFPTAVWLVGLQITSSIQTAGAQAGLSGVVVTVADQSTLISINNSTKLLASHIFQGAQDVIQSKADGLDFSKCPIHISALSRISMYGFSNLVVGVTSVVLQSSVALRVVPLP